MSVFVGYGPRPRCLRKEMVLSVGLRADVGREISEVGSERATVIQMRGIVSHVTRRKTIFVKTVNYFFFFILVI